MKKFLNALYWLDMALVIASVLSFSVTSVPMVILLGLYQLIITFVLMIILYARLQRPLQLLFNYYWAAILLYIFAFGAIGGVFLLTVLPIGIALYHLYLMYRLTKDY